MIGPSGNVRVLVATKPVDFRKGAEGLAAVVRESRRTDPFSGVVYVFRAKRADRVKLIFWDGSGVVLVAKRLENGQFRWPAVRDGVMRLSAAQLAGARAAADNGADRGELSDKAGKGRSQKPSRTDGRRDSLAPWRARL